MNLLNFFTFQESDSELNALMNYQYKEGLNGMFIKNANAIFIFSNFTMIAEGGYEDVFVWRLYELKKDPSKVVMVDLFCRSAKLITMEEAFEWYGRSAIKHPCKFKDHIKPL